MNYLNQRTISNNLSKKLSRAFASLLLSPTLFTVLSLGGSLSPMVAEAELSEDKEVTLQGNKHKRARTLAAIRKSTKQFTDVNNALDAGYVSTVSLGAGCVNAQSEGAPSQLGAMGIHFVNLSELGNADFDFLTPSVLVYAPDPDIKNCSYSTEELLSGNKECADSLRLVAVEELIFAHLWEASIEKPHWEQPPEFLGNQFYYLHDNPETEWVDEAHAFPPHYELHIWLYDHNPAGLFAPWNSTISCPEHMQEHGH